MKTKCIVAVGTALIFVTIPSLFAESQDSDMHADRDVARSHSAQRTSLADSPAKASQILGREIRDGNNHKIGKVRELALDLQNGRIVEVIVGTGGFLGMNERDIAVPPDKFAWDSDAKKLVCELDQEQLRNAPEFSMSDWQNSVAPGSIRSIYHRYDVAPYFIDETLNAAAPTDPKGAGAALLTSPALTAPTLRLGAIERARTVMGASVQNSQDEHVGKIENVIVDVGAGRIVVLVVSTGGFLGMGNEVSAIPAQAFRYDSADKVLHINTTREALRTMPHYKPNQWPEVGSPERVAMVYDAYSVPPYQTGPGVDNTAQNVRDRSGATVTPFDQGTSASDRAITAHIRREIMSRSDLSFDAQNVKIITIDGQVTLRGPVKNKTEEQAIIAIAKNAVAQNSKVTNQIQTINDPRGSTQKATTTHDSN